MPTRVAARGHDAAHQLVTHDGAVVDAGLATVVDVEVRSAKAGALDLDERVVVADQGGLRDGFVANGAKAAEGQRAQRITSSEMPRPPAPRGATI